MRVRVRVRVRVVERIQETPDAVSLVLDAQLPYRLGQFLTLQVPGGGARCYSLAGSPHTGDPLRITVKKVPGGTGSGWVCERLAPGDEILVLPPAGTFTPADLDRELLLVAGGSGITPLLSIAKSALAVGRGRITLLYANRGPDAVIHAGELRALAEAHPGRFTVVHWLESLQGLPTADRLGPLVAPYPAAEAYLCGPAPLMDAAETALRARGGALGRGIHRERYFSLSGDVFAPPPDATGAGAGCVTAEVELDGFTHTVAWAADAPLLDALLGAGVRAPYSCREGACSACCCRVVDGEVTMVRNEILDADDLAAGYVLACQALPLGPPGTRIRISYAG
ncbi:ferredoxin--NADP reductase [Streptomyces sp. G-G2]|uniref:ferredoxin--NADP reductase n=1 Tax=Streptomyces sp. G-G2 TaxID=3046201 RepID=UPI0024BB5203|nr:ferredoxin--NADP reductase [Streptomyces sp. G-G2]MDJ0384324.1 ferredoxin--NADP reductase [Streptomyces sp. G-G2]